MGNKNTHARASSIRSSGEPDAFVTEGEVIAGRYQLVARSGQGAMGSVWAAKHVALGHTVEVRSDLKRGTHFRVLVPLASGG